MGNGSSTANLSELVERHYATLFRYAYRLSGCEADAQDLVQQTFLAAQANLGQLRDPERAKSWLYTILRNNWLKDLRSRGNLTGHSLHDLPEPAGDEPSDTTWDFEQLQTALNELAVEFREVIVLYYFGEFGYAEIAEQLGVPLGTVMSRLSRGKAYLRRRLAPVPSH